MTTEKKSLVSNAHLEPLNWNKLEDDLQSEEEQEEEHSNNRHNYDSGVVKEERIAATKTKAKVNGKDDKRQTKQSNAVGVVVAVGGKEEEEEEEEQIETEDLLGLSTMMAMVEEENGKQTPSNGSSAENKKNGPDLLDNEDNAFESFDEAFTRRNPQHSDKEDSLSEHDQDNSQDELEMNDDEYYYMHNRFHTGDGNIENEKKSKNNNAREYVGNTSQAKTRNSEPMKTLTNSTQTSSIPERKIGVDLHKKGVEVRVRSDIQDNGSNKLSKKTDETTATTVQEVPEQKKSPPTLQAPKPPTQKYDCLPELRRGTALLKYGRQGYPHFRQFNLSQNNDELVWFSARKKLTQSSIRVKDITEVLSGQHTKEFRRISWTALESASFTIWYDGHRRSLNLVAKSVDEMQMWIDALRLLRERAHRGEDLSKLRELEVSVDFKDRNRPQSRKHSGNFLRSNETKDKNVDPIIHRQLLYEMASITKTFNQIKDMSRNETIQKSHEIDSINQILSELEERIEELKDEVKHTRSTRIAENDVWRTRIDLEALREKISVLIKTNNKKLKRRFSIF